MPLCSFGGSYGAVGVASWYGPDSGDPSPPISLSNPGPSPPTQSWLQPGAAACCALHVVSFFVPLSKPSYTLLGDREQEWGSFPTLYLVATPPSPLGLSSKISCFVKSSLPQAALVTSVFPQCSAEACYRFNYPRLQDGENLSLYNHWRRGGGVGLEVGTRTFSITWARWGKKVSRWPFQA